MLRRAALEALQNGESLEKSKSGRARKRYKKSGSGQVLLLLEE